MRSYLRIERYLIINENIYKICISDTIHKTCSQCDAFAYRRSCNGHWVCHELIMNGDISSLGINGDLVYLSYVAPSPMSLFMSRILKYKN